MARVSYSDEAFGDFERIIEFLLESSPKLAGPVLASIQSAILVLAAHPAIGRRVDNFRRELVISHGATGYLALYCHDARTDTVRILRTRRQREAGYRD